MKKYLTLFFLLLACSSFGQRTLFGGNNNYVAPVAPASLVTTGLVLNLDAGNSGSYAGTGTTWTDLSGRGNNGTLVNTITPTATNPGFLVFNGNGNTIAQGGSNPYVSLPQSSDFDFGTGLANTNLIILNQGNSGSYAAKIARDYTGGGYTDWYLPSAEELHKMVGVTALNLSNYYHSSTEYNSTNAIYEGLTIGDFYRTPGTGSYPSGTTKTGNPPNVRAIRSF